VAVKAASSWSFKKERPYDAARMKNGIKIDKPPYGKTVPPQSNFNCNKTWLTNDENF